MAVETLGCKELLGSWGVETGVEAGVSEQMQTRSASTESADDVQIC